MSDRGPLHVLRALAIALALAAPWRSALAQRHDPALRWRTVETPHFRVHFHEGLEDLARRAAMECESARARIAPVLGVVEGITDVVLSDETDDANGFATVVPYRAMHLFAVPPPSLSELNDHRDWLRTLVTHEYTHVVHLDQATRVPEVLNRTFGKLFVPNGFLPPWFIEGLATLHEGDDAETGRNASALFSMYVRAQVAERGLPQLDDVTNQPLDWPRGTSWYLYGGRFLASVAQRSGGDAAIRELVRDQGTQLWPWRSSTLAERALGAGWEQQWAEFRAEVERETAERLADVHRAPVTSFRLLTRRGARVEHPRWSPDGSFIAYHDEGLDELPGLRRVTPEGADLGRVRRVNGNGTLAVRSTTEAIVAITEVHHEFYSFDDLWSVDLATGDSRQLTRGARATDPDLVDGGRAVIFVSQEPPGRSAVVRLTLDGGALETIFSRHGAELFFPRLAPDGRRLAFEIQERGRRDVAIADLADGSVRFVTRDDAIDAQPAWSPDGSRLYFASDRGGVYDLWAYELADGSMWPVTRVETGAFEPAPSPDGRQLAFVTYSARGFDLAIMDVPRRDGAGADATARAEPAADSGSGAGEARSGPDFTVRDYSPWPTLRPHWWLPLLGSDGGGVTLGAISAGTDVVGRHTWGLSGAWGIESNELSYDAAYQARWVFPYLTVGSRRTVGTVEGPSDQLESRWSPILLAATFTRTRLASEQSLTLGWRAYQLHAIGGGTPVVPDPTVDPYRNGTASEWTLDVVHSGADRFTRSISAERGRVLSLGLRGATPDLGGDFRYAIARASWAEYLRVPYTRHVVLALRGAGGLATGTLGGRRPFRLGGVPPPDVLTLVAGPLLGVFGTPSDQLRGYADGALTGSKFALGNVELRFPLLAPQAGVGTVPVQLRRVHGAVFLDGGGTFPLRNGAPVSWRERIRFGAGGELRLEVVLGYQLRTDVRIGVAQGLGRLLAPWVRGPGADPLAETQVYITMGESF
ncbi:MAG TPA: BamA/TamA family outer membrane protein [Anaeromyxobacteraceae bacterium]|nr:BamA/TamA family outer membrane protein [Anaeromyxobacteraceae bacterium]